MSTRRKFLRDLAFVATLPALLGNLSPSCPSFEKPGLPIYLTHCHNWLNASLWNALLVGQISFDDLVVITNGFFSEAAKIQASTNKVKLIGRKELTNLLLEYTVTQSDIKQKTLA